MAMTPTVVPQYPDVPLAAGVPPVRRTITPAPLATALLAASDAFAIISLFAQGPQWGVFTEGGEPVAIADSVISVDYRKEARISNYPVEDGGFQSYDKVQMPFDARVSFAIGTGPGTFGFTTPSGSGIGINVIGVGSALSSRTSFLDAIDFAQKSLDLFAVTTPEKTYESANIVHYDYRRETRGSSSMIVVDVWLEEVRVTATTQFTNTKEATSADQQNGGTVQPATPTTTQSSAIGSSAALG